MKPIKLKIKTKTQQYPIIIGSNLITNISKILKDNKINFNQCFLIIDKNVPNKFISQIKNSIKNKKTYVLFFKANEIKKNQNNVNKIL